jgi:hypothetical protein
MPDLLNRLRPRPYRHRFAKPPQIAASGIHSDASSSLLLNTGAYLLRQRASVAASVSAAASFPEDSCLSPAVNRAQRLVGSASLDLRVGQSVR